MDARDEATSTESKQEGKYDMRGQEAAYLAEGQARQAAEIAESVSAYVALNVSDLPEGAPAAVGALVTLEAGDRRQRYFLGPRNGGVEVRVDDETVIVVTPSSPLGRQLVGRREGDSVDLPGRARTTKHRITGLR